MIQCKFVSIIFILQWEKYISPFPILQFEYLYCEEFGDADVFLPNFPKPLIENTSRLRKLFSQMAENGLKILERILRKIFSKKFNFNHKQNKKFSSATGLKV